MSEPTKEIDAIVEEVGDQYLWALFTAVAALVASPSDADVEIVIGLKRKGNMMRYGLRVVPGDDMPDSVCEDLAKTMADGPNAHVN
jgi:hypothetical protein